MKNTLQMALSAAVHLFRTTKKQLLLLLTLLSAHSSFSQTLSWARAASGTTHSQAYGTTVDQNGNVYTAGYFEGTVDFDPGAGVFNLSAALQDIFVQKLDASGNFIWAKRLGATMNDIAKDITVDSFGHLYITGVFTRTVDFDPGPGIFSLASPTTAGTYDAFILQLDTSGDFRWAKRWGNVYDDYANGVTTDMLGNVYVTGNFNDTVDFDPGPGVYDLTTSTTAGFIVKLDSSGSFISAKKNSTALTAIRLDRNRNMYVAGSNFISKLDSSANFLWTKTIGGPTSHPYISGLATDSTGNVFFSGYFDWTIDLDPGPGSFNITAAGAAVYNAFTAKLDASGNFVWGNQLASATGSYNMAICADRSGNVYISGMFSDSVDFDPGTGTFLQATPIAPPTNIYNTYIQRLDNNGNFLGAIQVVGANSETRAISVDRDKNIYIAGGIDGACDFDPGPGTVFLTSPSNMSMSIAKYSQSKQNTQGIPNYELKFGLTPNPNSGNFKISLSTPVNDAILSITNIAGQEVYRGALTAKEYVLAPELPEGMYLVRITSGNNTQVQKMIIAR